MTDDTIEIKSFPVNEEGAIVVHPGGGSGNVTGTLPIGYFPVDVESGGLILRLPEATVQGDMLQTQWDPNLDGKIDIAQLSGAEPTLTKGSLSGTTKQLILTGGDGVDAIIGDDIQLSLPQDIATDSSPLFNAIKLDSTPSGIPSDVGTIYYNEEYRCHTSILPNSVHLNIGQEETVQTVAGEPISNGDVVYLFASGGEHPVVKKASNTSYDNSNRVIGMATHSANTNEELTVTKAGIVHDLNTSAYSANDVLYLDVNGAVTKVKPTTDKTAVRIGYVHIASAIDGEILVDRQIEMNSAGMALDVQLRAASTDIPTTPTVFVWPTEVTDTLGVYDTSTGVITIPFSGDYTFVFMYNTSTTGSAKQLISAAQSWNGSTWAPLEFSTRQLSVAQGIKAQSTFMSTSPFTAGQQIRFVTWASTTGVTILTESPLAGYTIVAARMQITGIKTI